MVKEPEEEKVFSIGAYFGKIQPKSFLARVLIQLTIIVFALPLKYLEPI